MNHISSRVYAFLAAILLLLFFQACSDNSPVEAELEDTELEMQAGQMILTGFRGMTVSTADQVVKDIQAGRIGGVVLYDKDVLSNYGPRNIESASQVTALVSSLQSYSQEPLLVAVDQEGGRVARFKPAYGFEPTVSQQYLGTLNNSDTTTFYAEKTASLLQSLGVNMNFAPVVDVNINPENPVIGGIERSFSADPQIVTSNAALVVQAHRRHNVITSLKHFPGHGSSEADSHLGFTDITGTWKEEELNPYRDLVGQGNADIIMTAHIFNANLDPDYPATLSKPILDGILRQQIGFDGVIITDDMGMGAIANHYGLKEAVKLSINAGADILMFSNNLTYDPMIAVKVMELIKEMVTSGEIPRERITESYNRIMRLKAGL